jgi:hypothetical protein
MGSNGVLSEDLKSDRVKKLLEVVKYRKKIVEKENFEENLEADFLPYLQVESMPLIENELFERHAFTEVFHKVH